MIVVDTNVIASLYLPGEHTVAAERWLRRDAEWAAPRLWRSELRNVLALYVRTASLTFERAYAIQREAELLVADEYDVDSFDVLDLARTSGCTAYDCEFVAVAKWLDVRLVTADAMVRRAFPDVAVGLR